MGRVRSWCWSATVLLCLAGSGTGGQDIGPGEKDALRQFLQRHLRRPGLPDDLTTRFVAASFDLNRDEKPEFIVYLTGRRWCGTGGCWTLVLAEKGASFRIVSKISISRPPIRVLSEKRHGWNSLAVWVEGGGVHPGYEAELLFDGGRYASNPTIPPARRMRGHIGGTIIVSPTDAGDPLYP